MFYMLIEISIKNSDKMLFASVRPSVRPKIGSKVIKCDNMHIIANSVAGFILSWKNFIRPFKLIELIQKI